MMDSQEKTPQTAPQEVTTEVTSATPAENTQPATDTPATPHIYKTKQEVVERLCQIAASEETPAKEEIETLKTTFYKIHTAEREAQLKAYAESGADPTTYQIPADPQEEAFKAQMAVIREKRAKALQQQEEERQANLQTKLDIIAKIKAMATSPDEANQSYTQFKQLQAQWRQTGPVPPEHNTEIWRNYQLHVEQYYDLLRLNSEAREYDFKKNLTEKTQLCEAAERLAQESDTVSAFRQLQQLHEQYREIGPVARDQREQIWTRFKAASTIINKNYQQHFEQLRAKEEANLAQKTQLCEQIEALIQENTPNTASEWEDQSRQIIAIQAQWKQIGFAPQKTNVKIFERFRAACDNFFSRKAQYFHDLKQAQAQNAQRKRQLIEEAQALSTSTDWRATAQKLADLQKEWKQIGTVPKKQGDQLWNEFLTACNTFFDARNAAKTGTRQEEQANLSHKRDIITRLEAIQPSQPDAAEQMQALIEEYNATGHVPYKEKDTLYEAWHNALQHLRKELGHATQRRQLADYRQNLKNTARGNEDTLLSERSRLLRRHDQLRQEIQTYENNLGFLTASSKKGNTLIDEIRRKVARLKDDLALVREKIKAIDNENKQ